jgi:ABC-type multidrug transport system fused ATPase/permease subunit
VLFRGTVKENIQYNLANKSLDDCRNAAKLANALEFIEKDDFGK